MYHFHLPSRLARRDVNMTQGSITRLIINFALPLMVGNLFQQLYNMVDTWVVGNFVSNEAFSAVGTAPRYASRAAGRPAAAGAPESTGAASRRNRR